MSKNSKNNQNDGLDFVTPFVEVFTLLVQHIIEILQIILVFLITKLIEYVKVNYKYNTQWTDPDFVDSK